MGEKKTPMETSDPTIAMSRGRLGLDKLKILGIKLLEAAAEGVHENSPLYDLIKKAIVDINSETDETRLAHKVHIMRELVKEEALYGQDVLGYNNTNT